MSILALQEWYLARCNGDWEHQYGIKIDTLDNPGWSLQIDLTDTPAETVELDWNRIARTEHDWVHYHVTKKQFTAAMGPKNLNEVIEIFLSWFAEVDNATDRTGRAP